VYDLAASCSKSNYIMTNVSGISRASHLTPHNAQHPFLSLKYYKDSRNSCRYAVSKPKTADYHSPTAYTALSQPLGYRLGT
jgi:hypothetical protein